MRSIERMFLLSLVFCLMAGCTTQCRFEPLEQICRPGVSKGRLMWVAEDVLAKMHFEIAKADMEQGIITTRPLAGAQFFEFWRSDNVGAFNKTEANLHTIRRTAQMQITEQAGGLCIGCRVATERLSLPERQVIGSGQTAGMFSKSESSVQKLKIASEQASAMAWIDLGPDERLQSRILERIDRQLGRADTEKQQ